MFSPLPNGKTCIHPYSPIFPIREITFSFLPYGWTFVLAYNQFPPLGDLTLALSPKGWFFNHPSIIHPPLQYGMFTTSHFWKFHIPLPVFSPLWTHILMFPATQSPIYWKGECIFLEGWIHPPMVSSFFFPSYSSYPRNQKRVWKSLNQITKLAFKSYLLWLHPQVVEISYYVGSMNNLIFIHLTDFLNHLSLSHPITWCHVCTMKTKWTVTFKNYYL